MNKTISGMVLGIAAMLCLLIPRADAQVLYGSIVGNVTDQSGGVIAGAEVQIVNRGTGQVQTTTRRMTSDYTRSRTWSPAPMT